MADALGTAPELDIELVRGFRFQCRPDCGLCCYAEPRIEFEERARLVQLVPEVEVRGSGAHRYLAARPDGGACRLLTDQRCRAHEARPSPCREFPLVVHIGERLQATVVLSCPGVDIEGLAPDAVGRELVSGSLASELASLRARIRPATARRLVEAGRRRRRRVRELTANGRWEDEVAVRRRLLSAPPRPRDDDFPVEDPPTTDDGLERLPLFFDPRASPIALAAGLGGWELLELSPSGGVRRSWGVVPPPDRRPSMDADATALLDRYIAYWLRRDALFGFVLEEMATSEDDGTVGEWVDRELREIGATVLARADVRARSSRGDVAQLGREDIADGIRATDQDFLDRPTWGDRL